MQDRNLGQMKLGSADVCSTETWFASIWARGRQPRPKYIRLSRTSKIKPCTELDKSRPPFVLTRVLSLQRKWRPHYAPKLKSREWPYDRLGLFNNYRKSHGILIEETDEKKTAKELSPPSGKPPNTVPCLRLFFSQIILCCETYARTSSRRGECLLLVPQSEFLL